MTRPPLVLALIALAAAPACKVVADPPGGLLTFEVREVAWDPPTPRIVLFVSDDRAAEGLFPQMQVLDNLIATRLDAGSHDRVSAEAAPELDMAALGRTEIVDFLEFLLQLLAFFARQINHMPMDDNFTGLFLEIKIL